jgi:hypothetical protein
VAFRILIALAFRSAIQDYGSADPDPQYCHIQLPGIWAYNYTWTKKVSTILYCIMKVDTIDKDRKHLYECVAQATALGIRLKLLNEEYSRVADPHSFHPDPAF